jgi:hypothetical protein
MKNIYTLIITITFAFTGFSQGYEFGIVHNSDFNFSIVAVPSFDATDTDISDIGFALMLPSGDADIINISQFNGRNWTANQVTATQLTGAGLGDGTRDAFIMNLPPGQTILSHVTDSPFVLVTFDVSNSPTSGLLEILQNSDPIAQGLGGVADSFYNSNIDTTTTQDYYAGVVSGQESFMLETLGVDDVELESYTISVYPNPAIDMLHVLTDLEVLELKLFDILGKQVISIKNSKSMTVEHLRSGAYFLKIKTSKATVTKKIIVE